MVLSGGGDWWCDTVPTIFWETNDDKDDPDSPLSFVLGLLDLTVFLQARFGFPFRIYLENLGGAVGLLRISEELERVQTTSKQFASKLFLEL